MAGDEGFEPPITGPEPVALPLGQSPVSLIRKDLKPEALAASYIWYKRELYGFWDKR